MTRQTPQIKAHVDRNTGKLIKKKTHLQRLRVKVERVNDRILSVYFQEEKCVVCGFLFKNKILLGTHLRFEHEDGGEVK